MSWERDPRSGALLHKPDRRSEHVVPAWAIAGLREMLRFGHTAEELRPYGLLPPIAGGFDTHPNFAYSTVATAPSPASSGGSLVVAAGDGGQFASTPFNAVVCPAGTPPRQSNAEIVRITNRSTDTLTITRTQESTSARTILVGDQIFAAPTAKVFTDIEPSNAFTQFSADVNTQPSTATVVANTLYYMAIGVPYACTLTGIRMGLLTASAGNVITALYNAAGNRVAVSATTAVAAALNYQHVPFTGTLAAVSGLYYVAVIYSSATTSLYQATPMAASGSAAQGSFAAPASIVVPGATSVLTVPRMGTY